MAFVDAGEAGDECDAEVSNSWFAGEDMIESEVISDEMTSGEAGCMCTRFDAFAEGPCKDFLRECCRVRLGIGGGVEKPSMM